MSCVAAVVDHCQSYRPILDGKLLFKPYGAWIWILRNIGTKKATASLKSYAASHYATGSRSSYERLTRWVCDTFTNTIS